MRVWHPAELLWVSVTILDVSTPVTKRVFLTVLSAAMVLGSAFGPILGQTTDGTPFRIERLHPSLDVVVSAEAQLELLGDRFALTEGPVWYETAGTAICCSVTTRRMSSTSW